MRRHPLPTYAAALAALALVAAALVVGTTNSATAAQKTGSLRIVVTGLAHGVKAKIRAKSPHHKALRATGTKTFKKISPGNYTITIAPVRGYAQSAKKLTVKVKATRRTTVRVTFTRLQLKFSQVTTGSDDTCAVAVDHTAWCWGANHYGQLGSSVNISTESANPRPHQVPGGAVWTSLSASLFSTCGLRLDHTVWCWGSNQWRQLGTGTNAGSDVANPAPMLVPGGGVWASVSANVFHTCGIRSTDRSAWCWGTNPWGELGVDPTVTDSSWTPVPVAGGGSWRSITTGSNHTCGIKTDGSAWCWGANLSGALGNPTGSGQYAANPTPLPVTGGAIWRSLTAGVDNTCGQRSDNTVMCWGSNQYGQLGVTTGSGQSAPYPTPVQVTGGGTWATVATGGGLQACGTRPDGTGWCWGRNASGQLGDGTMGGYSAVPVKVPGSGWSAISTAGGHTCALKAGTVWCWGSNQYGEIGSGAHSGVDGDKSLVPIRVPAPWAAR